MYSIFKNKKGTEKPIEIFVALFVILAVALVMLKLFQNQITQKQNDLKSFEQEKKQTELKETAQIYCTTKCTDAANNKCSLKDLASFCLAYSSDAVKPPDFLDLNLNGQNGEDYTLMPGIGVCEDAVPCHAILSTCCGQQISAESCKNILKQYWDSQGFTPKEVGCLFKNNVKKGTCNLGNVSWYARGGFKAMADVCI